MTRRKVGLRATAGIGVLALGLAACGGSSGGSSSSNSGTPQKGGILKLVGGSDVDHLDTASGYTTYAAALERAWSRQLFNYKASNNQAEGSVPVPDLAAELPTTQNGGISADGKTYTIKLRAGSMWNTQPARPIVAGDYIRGLKRLCNPSPNGTSGGAHYYISTIAGMKTYCDGYGKVSPTSASAMATYQNTHDISGIKAPDDNTLVFTLVQPASDFINILAEQFASPAPKEYDQYVPDSATFRQHTISSGPYQISAYSANKSFTLVKNPAWSQASDPLRHQYLDGIQITLGQPDPTSVQDQVQAGTADLAWDVPPPTSQIATLRASHDPNLSIFPSANTNPYLLFNFRSPNNNKAMANLQVRQAIEYAINKVAIGKIYGGATLNKPLTTTIPPGSAGYQAFNDYPTPNNEGSATQCKTLLAQGLKAVGETSLTLNYVYRTVGNHPQVTQSVANDLKACGINTKLLPTSMSDFYGTFLANPDNSKQGKWDIAAPGWSADWPGNNGRAIIGAIFDGRDCSANSVNYGCYNSPIVDQDIDSATSAKTEPEAATFWHQADVQIMKDAAFVPWQQQLTPIYKAKAVHNALFYQIAQLYDYTNIWLSK
jgi:ABC-type transport system substrate-binding protein